MSRENDERRRVVVTGMGAITPLGLNVEDYWAGLLAGRSGVGLITQFDASPYPTRIAAEVRDFDPRLQLGFMEYKDARRMGRFSQFAVATAWQAIVDAKLDLAGEDPQQVGVVMGNAVGSIVDMEEALRTIGEKGPRRVSPFFMTTFLPNMPAHHVSRLLGLQGYTSTVSTACAASAQAIGEATEAIRRGAAQVILAGGTEGSLCEVGLAGFSAMRAMSTRNDQPERASRPFDLHRDGFVPGEGAGMMVLESLEHALERGARIYAEVLGYGACSEPYHLAQPDPKGQGAAQCMRLALLDAHLGPDEVDYVNAHGTSTPLNDVTETRAIKQVLGERAYRVPISSTKSMIGHLFGAAGVVEAIATVLTIWSGRIHPTINYETPDPQCDLDYVPTRAREARVSVALSNSFGLGGQNACLAFGCYP